MRCLLAAAFVLIATESQAQLNLDVLTRDGYGVVPIKRPRPNDLLVTATINGHKLNLILDTGFGDDGIILDDGYASRLGLTTAAVNGKGFTTSGKGISVRQAKADLVVLGNTQLKGVPLHFGIFNALRMAEMRKEIGADGFIGSGFLRTCSAVVDLHNLRLYLRPPGTGRRVNLSPALNAAGLSEAPFLRAGNNVLVSVEINGAPGTMILDTGATLSSVDPRFTTQMKTRGYASGIAFIDAAGVTDEAEKTPLKSFKVGGVPMRVPDLLTSKLSFYTSSGGKIVGLLGMDTLGQNWSILDFGAGKLYFSGIR